MDIKLVKNIWTTPIQQHLKRITHLDQIGFIPGMQGWFNVIHCIHSIFKNHVIIATDTEKHDNIQHSFMIKMLNKLWIEGNFLNLIKSYLKPTTSYHSEILISFPLDKYPEVRLLDHIVLVLIFWGHIILLFIVDVPTVYKGSLFLTSSPTLVTFWLFDRHPNSCSWYLWFWFAFPKWLVMLNTEFSSTCWPFVCLWKNVYSGPLPIF